MTDPDLVPDDFDLQDALAAESTTDGTGMPDCPFCQVGDVRPKSPNSPSSPATSRSTYYCKDCQRTFGTDSNRTARGNDA